MYQNIKNYRIFWEQISQQEARILRVFGTLPYVIVPVQVEGFSVTELGSLWFAQDCHLPERYNITEQLDGDTLYAVTELSGDYIESIELPDTLTGIEDYAFYNCRNLKKVILGKNLVRIGSDIFMNCRQLCQLYLKCSFSDKTSLRQILAQIFWDIEISFLESQKQMPACINTDNIKASIFYPEYYEAYDEIAPAHIFGRKITGEGFRARQAFKEGIIDFKQYDQIFQKACSEESINTMCHLLLCRLRYPIELTNEKKDQYENYLKAHGLVLCQWLIKEKQPAPFLFLIQNKLLLQQDLQSAAKMAAQAGWIEGSACLLNWKQQYYSSVKNDRFTFDDF